MALGPKSQCFRRLCFSFLFHHKMALERFTCSCFHFIAQGRPESEIYPSRTLKGTAPLLTLGLTLLHSLRCLKSAFSLQNMSLIPSAVSGSCRSTLASAVNLRKQNPTLVTATVTSEMFFKSRERDGSYLGMSRCTFLLCISLVQLCTVAVLMCGMTRDRGVSSSEGSTISMLMVLP